MNDSNAPYQPLDSAPFLAVEPLPPAPPVYAQPVAPVPPVPPQLVPPAPPAPPVAPAVPVAPYVGAAFSPSVDEPDWDTPAPRPAIADAVPDVTIDARDPRNFAPPQSVAPVYAPQPAPQFVVPSAPPVPAAPPSVAAPRLVRTPAPAPVDPNAIPDHTAPKYSPMRDDPNAYHVSLDHKGVRYYIRELDDLTRAYILGASPRFAEDPANRIVEVSGKLQPRPIALEEVIGGTVEKYGKKIQCEPGYIYTVYPELEGALTIRHLTSEEVDKALLLAAEHPTVYAKYLKAQVVDFERVLGGGEDADEEPGCLVGWSLPIPLTLEAVRGLAHSLKKWLYTRVAASSEFGVNEDDFFRAGD